MGMEGNIDWSAMFCRGGITYAQLFDILCVSQMPGEGSFVGNRRAPAGNLLFGAGGWYILRVQIAGDTDAARQR